MSYIFISYNENSRELADRVRDQLDGLGMATWVRDNAIDWDQEENAAILVKAIQAAAALLVVVPRDESNVDRISKDVHYGYQFEKPVLMLRRFEELPTFLQRLTPLVPQRTEYSPLPQPFSDDALIPPSFIARYGLWMALALMVSILVAGSLFVFLSQQTPPSALATLAPQPTTQLAPTNVEALLNTPTAVALAVTPLLPTNIVSLAPSATSTPSPTVTTAATSTPTSLPTDTFTPTSLPTLTATLAPSSTPTLLPTTTPMPATSAPTVTPTAIAPSPTLLLPVSTATTTIILIAPTFTPPATATVNGCPPPAGWVAYTVSAGDTLFSIAGRAGSTVEAVRTANCLSDVNTIFVGQTIYLPPTTAAATDTVLIVEGCDAPGVVISAPLAGATLSGVVEVRGTASIPEFGYYRVDIRAIDQPVFRQLRQGSQPVNDNALWRIDTEAYPSGIYYLRLTVITQRGSFPQPCIIPVIFE